MNNYAYTTPQYGEADDSPKTPIKIRKDSLKDFVKNQMFSNVFLSSNSDFLLNRINSSEKELHPAKDFYVHEFDETSSHKFRDDVKKNISKRGKVINLSKCKKKSDKMKNCKNIKERLENLKDQIDDLINYIKLNISKDNVKLEVLKSLK